MGSWRRCLERRAKLTKAQYPVVARAEAQKYNTLEDNRFALVTRRGPEPTEAPGGPPPTTSDKPKDSDPTSEQPTGIGAHPKTYRAAHYPRDQSSSLEEEDCPSIAGLRGRGREERRRSLTPKMPSTEAGTSSLSSTSDLGFNLEELTPESLPEKKAEGPTLPGAK